MRNLGRGFPSTMLLPVLSCALASTAAWAVRVPGTPPKAGCYAVFDVQGGTLNGKNKVTCTDGDPTCDIGGPRCQSNNVCTFMVRFCLNDTQTAPACKVTKIKSVKSKLSSAGTTIPGSGTECSAPTPIQVNLTKKGKKPGRKMVQLSATADKGFKPKMERAHLVLICNPRPTGAPCPTTTTTTTTSTTTTTIFMCLPSSFTCPPSTPAVTCMAGSNAFTKLTFTQTTGTANCGGAGVTQHCVIGEPGTDGKGACGVNGDCVGTCSGGFCVLGENPNPCTTDSQCVGVCSGGPAPSAPFSGTFGAGPNPGDQISGLGLSCLYLGGGNANVTPPSKNPDGSMLDFAATCCSDSPSGPHLLATGANSKTCSKGAGPGKQCANGSAGTGGGACATDADCGNTPGSCALIANCFFGPPLPIPSGVLSTCVLNVIQQDACGQLGITDGSATLTIPLSSRVFLTSNNAEPCPLCTGGTCDGGPNAGKPCTAVGSETTTQDCPPAGGSTFIGAIPVTLADVTTGTSTATADVNGDFCASVGQGTGMPAGTKGGFGNVFTKFISETGSKAGPLTDLNPHPSILGSTFCVPASNNPVIDGAANLPGPGATSLPYSLQLAP